MSRYEKTTPVERIAHEWCACNSVTPVRDQTVGRRAAYLYTLRARRPVERRRSCRVVSRREEPKARSALPPPSPLPSASTSYPPAPSVAPAARHHPLAALVTWDVASNGDGSRCCCCCSCFQLSRATSGNKMLASRWRSHDNDQRNLSCHAQFIAQNQLHW